MMAEIGASNAQDSRRIERELWLAMQEAHNRYKDSSAALDALTASPPSGGSSSERDLEIEPASVEQRIAFENYIEARLQLSEFLASRQNAAPRETVVLKEAGGTQGAVPRVPLWVVPSVMAVCLFTTALGVGCLVEERRQSRALEVARSDANAALNQTRQQVEALSNRMEALKTANMAGARSGNKPAALPRSNHVRSYSTAVRLTPSTGRTARNDRELVEQQRGDRRNYREFTLTPLKHSARIGPVGLTLLKVDPELKFFDLSITVDNLRPNKKRVNLNKPVWIDLSGRPRAVVLVVNRINRDRVQGYLSEPKNQLWTWRRDSPETRVVASR
jgi:hypothetical protein